MSETEALETKPLSYDPVATRFPGDVLLAGGKSAVGMDPASKTVSSPDELDLFHDFTTRHLSTLARADVQCRLIWAEWVRYHLRQTRNFPRLILEAEFNYLITGLYNTRIVIDEHRGRVYSGLRFIP